MRRTKEGEGRRGIGMLLGCCSINFTTISFLMRSHDLGKGHQVQRFTPLARSSWYSKFLTYFPRHFWRKITNCFVSHRCKKTPFAMIVLVVLFHFQFSPSITGMYFHIAAGLVPGISGCRVFLQEGRFLWDGLQVVNKRLKSFLSKHSV